MTRGPEQLRSDALAIWHAAVAAVDSARLVRENVTVDQGTLIVTDLEIPLDNIRRIAVVGGGKAGAGMAAGTIEALGTRLCQEKQLAGWLNVPDDCVRELPFVHLHGARPAGLNEPTSRGVEGTERILQLVQSLNENDLCFCLLSGGGSALLPAPAEGVSLEEKQLLTRHLSAAGANIQQLNTVRKQLSRIKGGRLAAACRAGYLIVLIISDVLGDPLDVIASGPTAADTTSAADALQVLRDFRAEAVAPGAAKYLQRAAQRRRQNSTPSACEVFHRIIGNNAVAVDAAGMEAERRGYRHAMICANRPEGAAEDVGRHLAQTALQMQSENFSDCLITGGEPVVQLAPAERRGKGGRNQQLVLAALDYLQRHSDVPCRDLVLLSGGTDGEDGPTDAAGALIDQQIAADSRQENRDPSEYLMRNDAYHFFDSLGALIKTGPTHTNVCDVRVVVTEARSQSIPPPLSGGQVIKGDL